MLLGRWSVAVVALILLLASIIEPSQCHNGRKHKGHQDPRNPGEKHAHRGGRHHDEHGKPEYYLKDLRKIALAEADIKRHIAEEEKLDHKNHERDSSGHMKHHERNVKHHEGNVGIAEAELEEEDLRERRRQGAEHHVEEHARAHRRKTLVSSVKKRHSGEKKHRVWKSMKMHRRSSVSAGDHGDGKNSATEDESSRNHGGVQSTLPIALRGMFCLHHHALCHYRRPNWRHYHHSHSKDVGVCCRDRYTSHNKCKMGQNGKFKLSPFYGSKYGLLQYNNHGRWGTVNRQHWSWVGGNNSRAVCRKLFGSSITHASWKTLGKEPSPCNAGKCKHGGYHSRPYQPCHCVCRGIWTGSHCDREIQRDCNSLDNDITDIFARVSNKERIPLNVLQAAQGLAVTTVRGVQEINNELRVLQGRQHNTNRCHSRMNSNGLLYMAKRAPMSASSFFGVDVQYMLEHCDTKNNRMRLFMKLQMSPSTDAKGKSTVMKQFRAWLGLTGELPWERNLRLRRQAMREIDSAREKLVSSTQSMNQRMTSSQEKASSQKRRLVATNLAAGISENSINQGMAAKRGFKLHLSEMEEALANDKVTVHDTKARLGRITKGIRDRLENDINHMSASDGQRQYKSGVDRAKEFTAIVRDTLMKLRKRNEKLYRRIKGPLQRANIALSKFAVSRLVLRNATKRDYVALRRVIRKDSRGLRKLSEDEVKRGKKLIAKGTKNMSLDEVAKAENDMQRLIHKYEDFQLNQIDNGAKEFGVIKYQDASVRKGIKAAGEEEEHEFEHHTNLMKAVIDAIHHYDAKGKKEQLELQAKADKVNKDTKDDIAAVKKFSGDELEKLYKRAGELSEGNEKTLENKDTEFQKKTLSELEDLQKRVNEEVKHMEDYAGQVESLFQKREQMLMQQATDKKNLYEKLIATSDKFDMVEKKIPTIEEIAAEDEFNIHAQEAECEKHAMAIATNKAKSAANDEIAVKHPTLIHDIAAGKELYRKFMSDCSDFEPSGENATLANAGGELPNTPDITPPTSTSGATGAESAKADATPASTTTAVTPSRANGQSGSAVKDNESGPPTDEAKVFPEKEDVLTNSNTAMNEKDHPNANTKKPAHASQNLKAPQPTKKDAPHVQESAPAAVHSKILKTPTAAEALEEMMAFDEAVPAAALNMTSVVKTVASDVKSAAEKLADHVLARHHAHASAAIEVMKNASKGIADAIAAHANVTHTGRQVKSPKKHEAGVVPIVNTRRSHLSSIDARDDSNIDTLGDLFRNSTDAVGDGNDTIPWVSFNDTSDGLSFDDDLGFNETLQGKGADFGALNDTSSIDDDLAGAFNSTDDASLGVDDLDGLFDGNSTSTDDPGLSGGSDDASLLGGADHLLATLESEVGDPNSNAAHNASHASLAVK